MSRALHTAEHELRRYLICRNHSTNVKNWQSGDMALRWCAAGLVEAGKQFRRVNGHMHLPTLRTALQRHVAAQGVSTDRQDENVNVA
jgi:putative transposase